MASIVGKAIKGFCKALKYHKAKSAVSKKIHTNFQTGKPFSKSTQEHMRKSDLRELKMKREGWKKEPYKSASVKHTKDAKTGEDVYTHKLKEVWSMNPYKKAKKKNKLVSIAKKTAPIGAAAAAGEAYGRHRSKK